MKKVIMYIIVFVLGIVLGGLGVHFVSDYQTDRAEDKYESSYRDSRASSLKSSVSSQSNDTESSQAVSLPAQAEVTKRVSNDLDKFIAEQKDGLIKTASVEDAVDAFEDSYLDTYEDELQTKYPGDANEDQIEHLVDTAVATLNIHQKISDNK